MARKVVIIYYNGRILTTVHGMLNESSEALLKRVNASLVLAVSLG